ncbi:MAG: LPS biosynthesis protein [Elusimicrobia bacterium RIFOXYA1_FULL_47_7]|nr:MAG: LPS biosynthesis protein [Elusimicrobia bacterium RIFOXYA12_FULL_49_49]OGS10211.1 MAG: LPS biosynthesis protein [Elusimicrobia bacterium RIFOXYA1_FULL_47_7]OGS16785.1 MAG: LPS biosynthesis protein [Elusimicrobia bacterium RIFOXYA2_FULL_47_53]OGS32013.1 MAG: LPS biosynthesis protein [Elusimicrobia bacterium RIFOXYB2_FULL_46_23]
MEKPEVKYGLPEKVVFCKRCVMSNQRPASTAEFKHTSQSKKVTLRIDEEGVCDACRHAEAKENIDWKSRESELIKLLDKYRRNDGHYDCIVPGSGGKDSAFQSHILKYKYGMHPLTITWPPILYTDYGYQNFKNWIEIGGFDNITFKQNGRVMKLLTKLSIENLLHPFQTFILGQKNLAPKIAAKYGIPLIFYGENEAEYGNPVADNTKSLRDKSYYSMNNIDEIFLGGVSIAELRSKYNIDLSDLRAFLPAESNELEKTNIEVHYLGYYLKWIPQEVYYYAVENTGFKARPFRTQGTYSKYNSIDDKIDDLHYYTTFIKFGIGRTTYDASQEIRNKHLTRDDGKALVKRFDGEFPDKYFKEIMEYLDIKPEIFMELCDKFRSPHLWGKVNGEWKLRHTVNEDGTDDK